MLLASCYQNEVKIWCTADFSLKKEFHFPGKEKCLINFNQKSDLLIAIN